MNWRVASQENREIRILNFLINPKHIPLPLDNPDNQAVLAAVDMMHRLEELNRTWEERGDFSMQMGIGICTGEVFLGNIGSVERMEFTVIGDTVNMASRLSGVAKGGQIVVTEVVRAHLEP
jgi:adenylate cyclase